MSAPAAWSPPFKPETPVGKAGNNIFAIIAGCRRFARQLGWPSAWVEEFCARVRSSRSYADALAVVREHFTLVEEAEE